MEEKDKIEKGLNDLYIYWKKLDYQSNSSSELSSILFYYSKYYSSLLFSMFISFSKLCKKN